MSKHSELSQLADAAFAHYPIRRKGERRRLNPNWDGIDWLEAETRGAVCVRDEFEGPDGNLILETFGGANAKAKGAYVRPMILEMPLGVGSASPVSVIPCPGCDDWSRTSKCRTHHDRDGFDGLVKGNGHAVNTAVEWIFTEVNVQGVREVSYQIEREGTCGQETITYHS